MSKLIPYNPPTFKNNEFNCPYCQAFSAQGWCNPSFTIHQVGYGADEKIWICRCGHCKELSIWYDKNLIVPTSHTVPAPNSDIPNDIQTDYNEARDIASNSPRGAAALLRLCIQKLCKHLGETGKNINDDIASLVKKGLPVKIQKALDIVRVVGNNAVHPGQLDLKDNIDTANKMFGLVNLISDVMITQPKHIDELYESVVPDSQKDAILRRDKS